MQPRAHATPGRAPARRAAGFTLMELMLVVAIIGVVVAITMPMMAKSIRGNRVRMAVRSVVSAGRYARTMAILKQRETVLALDLAGGRVTVEGEDTITRTLDGVAITAVEDGSGKRTTEGTYRVVYHTQGRCDPYRVWLELPDSDAARVEVSINHFAEAEVTNE